MPDIRYGGNELPVKQAAQVSSVWPSVMAAPVAAALGAFFTTSQAIAQVQVQPVPQVFQSIRATQGVVRQMVVAKPQADPTQTPSVVFKPSPQAQGTAVKSYIAAPQANPTQIQPQVFRSAVAAVVVSANRRLTMIVTAPQPDPSQVQSVIFEPNFNRQGKLGAMVVQPPQADPTQVQPQIYRSVIGPSIPLRLTHFVPQSDPTQIQPAFFSATPAVPILTGPVLKALIVPGQPDLNINYSSVWTPSVYQSAIPPVLTSAVPSGVIATATTANIGATTNQISGTGYFVAALQGTGLIAAISASQIKAGNRNDDTGAGVLQGTVAIASASWTIPGAGFSANTAYEYAVVQNNANGDSNVLEGSFTTALTDALGGDWIIRIHRRGRR